MFSVQDAHDIKLKRNQTHLWFIHIHDLKEHMAFLNDFLSEDERLKALKFRFEKDKNSSIITRGALRYLSSIYLNLKPKDIIFKYGDYGKPDFDLDTKLKFNVSHSGAMAIIGFVLEADIGVDIEHIKSDFDVLDIASNYFSNSEIASLKQLPQTHLARGFYRCWTRKESFIKAKAKGLSFPLDSFSVSIDSDDHTALLETKWNHKEKDLWRLFSFSPQENYLGAISVKGNIKTIRYYNFKDLL